MTAEETRAVLSAIKTRRSFRKYKSTPVPQELIDQVIEAGTYAASGKGYQPWRMAAQFPLPLMFQYWGNEKRMAGTGWALMPRV